MNYDNFSPDSSSTSTIFEDDSLIEAGLELSDTVEEKPRKGSRKGSGNAEKRSQHNAIERARRESLNGRFIVLSEALPLTTAERKRPSKSMIVNKALDFVHNSAQREQALTKENEKLRAEVQQLRAQLGLSPLPPSLPLPAHAHHTSSTTKRDPKKESKCLKQESPSHFNLVTGSGSGNEHFTMMESGSSSQLTGRHYSITPGSLPSPALSILQTSPNLNSSRFPDVIRSPVIMERTLANFNFEAYPVPVAHAPYSLQQSHILQQPIQHPSLFYMHNNPICSGQNSYYHPRSQSLPEVSSEYSLTFTEENLWAAVGY